MDESGAAAWQIVIAPDSFKGSLSALEAAEAMEEGVRRALPSAQTVLLPVADGGEGTVDAVLRARGGRRVAVEVTGPLGTPVRAAYGLLPDGQTAILEMAAASGLMLVPTGQKDPRRTTTYGTGELIRSALEQGARRIILGIGGSATNDGGAGMAQALGIPLLDEHGDPLPPGGAALSRLRRIDTSHRLAELEQVEIIAACDVDNPLIGPRGASAVYGPQKGATPQMVAELDAALGNLAAVIRRDLGLDVANLPGAGAAGGLGAGLIAFVGARLQPGFPLVAELLDLETHIAGADLVLTGEGAIDAQTAFGKVPVGVARIAARHGVPVVAVGGGIGPGVEELYAMGVHGLYPATGRPMPLEEAVANARRLVATATRHAMELLRIGYRLGSRHPHRRGGMPKVRH